jgi:hypothetical protein
MNRLSALFGLLVFLSVFLFAEEKFIDGQKIELNGTIHRVGNEPFTELVLRKEDGTDWYISKDDRAKFDGMEQKNVTVRGTVELLELIFANKKKAGTRLILKDVEIIR